MANKRPSRGTSPATPGAKRQKTGSVQVTREKRFKGTNIDILKANRLTLKTGVQQPVFKSSARSEPSPPPDSVGPPFTPPVLVHDAFVAAVRAPRRGAADMPLGIHNLGNHCYRNAVLTLFINSKTFSNYLIWYRRSDSAHSIVKLRRSHSLLFSLRNFTSISVSLKPRADRQTLLNSRIDKFWREVGYPPEGLSLDPRLRLALPPCGAWRKFSRSGQHEQLDANEFLTWICTAIDGQLSQHHYTKDFRVHRNKTSAQQNFDWLTNVRRASRVDCPECRWRVQRRIRIEPDRPLILNIPDLNTSASNDNEDRRRRLRLEDCMASNLHDNLDGDLRCQRCKKTNTGAVKRSTFQQAPEILLISFARFQDRVEPVLNADGSMKYDERGNVVRTNVGGKDFTAVTIPEVFELNPWLNHHQYGPGSQVSYRLAGLVSHRGRNLNGGHYKSYVRGGPNRDMWFELNDEIVSQCELKDFDDSQAHAMDDNKLRDRFAPCIMLYEKDHSNEVSHAGFHTINVDEGDEVDARPTYWTGCSPPPHPPPKPSTAEKPSSPISETVNNGDDETEDEKLHIFEKFPDEEDWPCAKLDVAVTIDGERLVLPQCAVRHFDKRKARSIEISAALSVPQGTEEEVQTSTEEEVEWSRVDLAKAYVDTEVERVEYEKEVASMERRKRQFRSSLRKEKLSAEEIDKRIEKEEAKLDRELEKWKASLKQTSWVKRWKKV